MITQFFLLISFLLNFSYEKDITLGAPDTVKILVNPIKVVEQNDTIVVLDQEGDFQFIKKYTLDGFFIEARLYAPKIDSLLFCRSWVDPDPEIAEQVKKIIPYVSSRIHLGDATWKAMYIEPDGTIWLVCSCWDGYAGWMAIIAVDQQDSVSIFKVAGYGSNGGDYAISTLRRVTKNFYFNVGERYVYLISSEFLWQYDREARFIRKIGIEPNQCFKEPCGIAIDHRGFVYITDFRLGLVWKYRPGGRTLQLQPLIVNENIRPETPTYLAFSKLSGLWVTDVEYRMVKNIRYQEVINSFNINEIHGRPGGTNFQLAVADSLLFVYYSNQILIYTLYGQYIETYQRTDYEGKKDNIVAMDNTGNFYMFKREKDWGDVTFYRIDPIKNDTSVIMLPDSFQLHRLNWSQTYRTGDTLYMYGKNNVFRSKGESSTFRGFFVFVNDTLTYTIAESEFEGGLPERIIDFAVDSYGIIWIVDLENRIVQRYRLLPEYYD